MSLSTLSFNPPSPATTRAVAASVIWVGLLLAMAT